MIYANGQLIDAIRVKDSTGTTKPIINVTCTKTSTGKKHYVFFDYDVGFYINNSRIEFYFGDYLGKVGIMTTVRKKGLLQDKYPSIAWLREPGQGYVITVDDNSIKGAFAMMIFFHPFCSDAIIKKHMDTLNDMAADKGMNEAINEYNYNFMKTPGNRINLRDYTGRGYVTAADCNEQIFGFVTPPTVEPGDSFKLSTLNFIDNWYNAQ